MSGLHSADLSAVARATLEDVRAALADGRLRSPVTRTGLSALGIRHQQATIAQALAGHPQPACLAIVDVVLAERAGRGPAPELVWTGPEPSASTSRDTAVVLRRLFEGARQRVLLAGYSFSHAETVLAPLQQSMVAHGVEALLVLNIRQAQSHLADPAGYAAEHLRRFIAENWPFGSPYPRLFYDRRALYPGPPWCSVHAKCVVVDEARVLVSSANFTERGQERNIEVGVALEDARFAGHLARQWHGLIASDKLAEWVVATDVAG